MASPFVATNRLGNIMQMISLSGQTGMLRAMRGTENNREYGQAWFVRGVVESALLGQLTGEAALTALANWGDCVYSFDESLAADNSGPWQSNRPTGALGGQPGGQGDWPAYAQSWPTEQVAGYGFAAQQDARITALSEPLGPGVTASGPLSPAPSWVSGGAPTVPSAVLSVVPRRTPLGDQIDRLPLDRRERMLLMLVDGNRTVSDLGRLNRLSDRDTYAVLQHLANLGCVELDGRPAR